MGDTTYLFVDGGYLDSTLKNFCDNVFHQTLEIDYEVLGRGCSKAFYYDAYPVQKETETLELYQERSNIADKKFDEIASCSGWHVNFGFTRGQGKRVRQKGVDVQLAIDAFTHKARGNCRKILLLAGDLDFYPLVKALVYDGAHVELWCDPLSTSKEMIQCADSRRLITPRSIQEYVRNKNLCQFSHWKKTPIENLPAGILLKRGEHRLGWVEIRESGDTFHAIEYRSDVNVYHVMSWANFNELWYVIRGEKFHVDWR